MVHDDLLLGLHFDWLIRLLHLQTRPSFASILAMNFHPFFVSPCLELYSSSWSAVALVIAVFPGVEGCGKASYSCSAL
jgi:hypothetical protein